ncbi:hypothetical protein [uncultured Eubacterium sp.]|uniref:hypothetical protein n=1 Tax=uncultured Eubacterium sp. TaxID=165185 RepID=UPI002596F528|nr:hypothetical protein [uncultured Eubacterium sp.]
MFREISKYPFISSTDIAKQNKAQNNNKYALLSLSELITFITNKKRIIVKKDIFVIDGILKIDAKKVP